MEQQSYIENIQQRLPEGATGSQVVRKNRYVIDIRTESLLQMASHLYHNLRFRFIIASAFESKQGFEILYHFSDDEAGSIISLHVIMPHDKPEVDSLANMFSGANWIEREMREILGITFRNHPEPEKLLSEGNWAEGVYPYRKNYKS